MKNEETIAKAVRVLMATKSLRVKGLSTLLPYGEQAITNQLNNHNSWSVKKIYEYAEVFGLTGSELLVKAENLALDNETSLDHMFGGTANELTSKLTIGSKSDD